MKEIRSDLVALLPESFVSRIPEGEEFAAWVAAGPDELVTVLATLAPYSLEAAARALAKLGDPAVEVLTRTASTVMGKPSKKALRRALHALRSRGVAVADVRTPELARVPGIRKDPGQAFAGPIDPEGRRVLMLVVPGRPNARLYQVLASDREGIVRVEVGEARRREVRSWVREIRGRSAGVFVDAPPSAVRTLLARTLRLGAPERSPELSALEAEIESHDADEPSPGELVRDRLAHPPVSDSVAFLDLRQRLERREIAPWVVTTEGGEAGVGELESMEESLLILSPVQKEERRRAGLGRLAGRLLDPEARGRLSARLEETAYLMDRRGDRDGARAAARVASRIRGEERPEEIEFVRLLLELSLQDMKRSREREGGGTLVVPA